MLSFIIGHPAEFLVSAGFALVAASAIRFKDWEWGTTDHSPPFPRTVVVLFLAVLASIFAMRYLDGVERGIVVTLAAAAALSVILNERRPLFSRTFITSASTALTVCLFAWGLIEAASFFSGDPDLILRRTYANLG